MRIMFWNTNKNKEINPILCQLILENDVLIVVLAEYEADCDDFISKTANIGRNIVPYITTGCDRIKLFGSMTNVVPSTQSHHASVQIINDETILCSVHLPSKSYPGNSGSRNIIINQIIKDLENTELKLKTESTIIVGDFNINPYESSCIEASLFHSMPIYNESAKRTRTVAGQKFRMFYNPMWNFLGDFKQPYGTYYYNGSSSDNTYWHIYDQVMIRPALRQNFVDSSLKIITQTNSTNLLDSRGHPNNDISDHLPIIFEIKENKHEK